MAEREGGMSDFRDDIARLERSVDRVEILREAHGTLVRNGVSERTFHFSEEYGLELLEEMERLLAIERRALQCDTNGEFCRMAGFPPGGQSVSHYILRNETPAQRAQHRRKE